MSESTRPPAPMSADTLRRAIAAGPISIVIFFVTLVFTAFPAVELLQGTDGSVVVLSSFSTVVWSMVAVVALSVGFGFTVGRRLDEATAHYPKVVSSVLFGACAAGIGLGASAVLMPFVQLVEGVTSSEVLLALMLVLALPAMASGFGTRWVLEASSESWTEVIVAIAVAAVAIGLFIWVLLGYRNESQADMLG